MKHTEYKIKEPVRWCDVGTSVFFSFSFNRKSEEEVDMDKVTAAMVLTSLSTSPLVRSPPVKVIGKCTVLL